MWRSSEQPCTCWCRSSVRTSGETASSASTGGTDRGASRSSPTSAPGPSIIPPTTAFDLPDGVQFALQPVADGFLVTDGHHNRVLHVSSDGGDHAADAVPEHRPHRAGGDPRLGLHVRGGPDPSQPGDGKVVSFPLNPAGPNAHEVASGYSLLVDVEPGPDGALYALSQGDSPGNVPPASPAAPDSGELLLVNRNGSFTVLVDELDLPTSLDFVGNTAFVTTLNGEVWKITNVSKFIKQ